MRFSLASYNILASAYLRPDRYPRVEPVLLGPSRRTAAVSERVAGLGADVLCLQEVERLVLAALAARLEPDGYLPFFAPKGGDKPDGCAVFVKRAVWRVRDWKAVLFRDGGAGADSGHGAAVLLLEREGRRVLVANTHLKWDPPGAREQDSWGLRQLRALLAECELAGAGAAWVLCGDFNAEPQSPAVALLERRGMLDAYRGRPWAYTCNSNVRAKRIDYLFHTPDLAAVPTELPPLGDLDPLPSEREPSDHLPIAVRFLFAEGGRPAAHLSA